VGLPWGGMHLPVRAGLHLPDRLLDRLIGGRAWIAVIAFALIGIVGMQLWVVKLGVGIGRAVEHTQLLQQENSVLSAEDSALSSGERIERLALAKGMVPASPAALHFDTLRGPLDARLAAAALAKPIQAQTTPSTPGGGATASTQPSAGSAGTEASANAAGSAPSSSAAGSEPSASTPSGAATSSSPTTTGTETTSTQPTAPEAAASPAPTPAATEPAPAATGGSTEAASSPTGAGGDRSEIGQQAAPGA
jgi:cell division protein FtsL